MKPSTKKALGITAAVVGIVGAAYYGFTKLVEAAEKATCSGTVRDATTGESLDGVLVTLNSLETLTDLSGSYMFEDVTAGKHTLSLFKEGFTEVSMTIELQEGANTVDVNLVPIPVPEASVVLTVIADDTGNPVEGVTVVLAGITRITDSSGQCQFTGIIEGDYPISFVKEGYETYEDTVSFHPIPIPTPSPDNYVGPVY